MRVFGPGVLVVVTAACGPAQPSSRPLGNQAWGSAQPAPIGDYACRIQEDGYDYPAFRCVVRPDSGRYMLEKIEGSVRFRGVIAARGDGFRFDGEVFCPWGDCTEPVSAEFRASGSGYVASFTARRAGPAMTVTLEPVYGYGGGAYGGYGYGGGYYGGYGYGGGVYGGYGYGGYGYGGRY